MGKFFTKDRIAALGFIVLSVLVIVFSGNIRVPKNISEPGPRLFPYIAAGGIFVCSLGMMFTKNKNKEEEPFIPKGGWKRLGMISAVLVGYYLGMKYLGFIISTPLALFGFIMTLRGEKKAKIFVPILVSIIVTAVLYVSFVYGFKVYLPIGKIWG